MWGRFTCESHFLISRGAFFFDQGMEWWRGGVFGGVVVVVGAVMNIFICALKCPVRLKCHACVVLMYAI